MKISYLLALLFAGGALAIGEARAQNLYFDFSGTFDSTAPTTLLSETNTTFDLQFSLPENFASLPNYSYTNGSFFNTLQLESESYTLGNNSPVTIATNKFGGYMPFINVQNPSISGTTNVFFAVPFQQPLGQGQQVEQAQDEQLFFGFSSTAPIYSGPESDPTIIPGTYAMSGPSYTSLSQAGTLIGSFNVVNEKLAISTSPFSPVPETSQLVLIGGVISSAVGFSLLRRRGQRANLLCA